MTIRVAMWSGPRNLSTAMMRSFGSRSDTFVSDEPFYGAYLKQWSLDGVFHADSHPENLFARVEGPPPARTNGVGCKHARKVARP